MASTDILASEHEEAVLAAMHAYKSLIDACVDEKLVKQGVDQVMSNARQSVPTIIEKVCAIVGRLVDYNFSAVWAVSLQVISAMFYQLGKCIPLSSVYFNLASFFGSTGQIYVLLLSVAHSAQVSWQYYIA